MKMIPFFVEKAAFFVVTDFAIVNARVHEMQNVHVKSQHGDVDTNNLLVLRQLLVTATRISSSDCNAHRMLGRVTARNVKRQRAARRATQNRANFFWRSQSGGVLDEIKAPKVEGKVEPKWMRDSAPKCGDGGDQPMTNTSSALWN